ncbi:nitrate reductase molybdenum cofactor assembly chaperone [Mobilicoccus caccae]|uniref:Nitrate reductase molybdenum cofactor assembly chaperone n=1 Tax=Mobilicoccus caccae TaxID=1859295 RepID=A0ABQ6ITM5_9MICO|nr:nitrate reductase molybdenum cofactor assembly chaperone [Mobilicoccus caccae]GMA41285.1 nitrate reductase molybdenum cofactor assembly chaperone [Mobilicoccus caccae]
MKLSLPLLRRKPAPAIAAPTHPEERDPETGTPWEPSVPAGLSGHMPDTAVPRSATVLERSRGVRVTEADRVIYQAASLLLDYPDDQLLADLPVIRAAIEEGASGPAARHLLAVVEYLEQVPLQAAQFSYVETFDLRRRCCLHLTYYAYGDTRRRGMALLDIKQAYQRCGATLAEDELPDHLCVALDFAASVDGAVGRTLLLDHRPGLELLRISLTDRQSPYAHAIEAVTCTLPALAGQDRDTVRSLIASGPPDEQVGMEAFVSGSHAASGARV